MSIMCRYSSTMCRASSVPAGDSRYSYPLLEPVPPRRAWTFTANLGLPRTGTNSVALASALVGMRSRHGWCHNHTEWDSDCPKDKRHWTGRTALRGEFNVEDHLSAYDGLNDVPFNIVSREAYMQRAATGGGMALFVCTIRPRRDWLASMINHGSAGGVEMLIFMLSLNLTDANGVPLPRAHFPWWKGHNQPPRPATYQMLGAYYDWHLANACPIESERIWLNASSAAKWTAFCLNVPLRFRERCSAIEQRNICWPQENAIKRSRNTTHKDADAAADAESQMDDCVPWPPELCVARHNYEWRAHTLGPNRTDEGSFEGVLHSSPEVYHIVCASQQSPPVTLSQLAKPVLQDAHAPAITAAPGVP